MDKKSNTVQPDGEKVRFHRIKMGLTQEDLEDETDKRQRRVSKRTIERIEAGCSAHINTIRILADALGVEPDALLKGNESIGRSNGVTPSTGISPELAKHFISFQTLIEDRTKEFTGRKFVFDKIEGLLHEKAFPCGYIVIEGDPGIGKSALMAQLITTGGYFIHHFNVALQSINGPRQFIGNICARIISAYKLSYAGLPDDYDKDGSFLNRLLEEVAGKPGRQRPLIIAVDALDEVYDAREAGPNNLLFLPYSLPENIYVIATTRRLHDLRLRTANCRIISLDAQSLDNGLDVEAYIRKQVTRKGIKAWMERRQLEHNEFVDEVATRSEGNFMYLRHVLPAIEQGQFFEKSVDELPYGLRSYYHCHWAQMRHNNPDTFERLFQPVVCVLAAAQECVSAGQIAEWTKLNLREVRDVLRKWSEFLHFESDDEGRSTCHLYHTAFRDFLREEVNPDLRTYHSMIAESALSKVRKQSSPDFK